MNEKDNVNYMACIQMQLQINDILMSSIKLHQMNNELLKQRIEKLEYNMGDVIEDLGEVYDKMERTQTGLDFKGFRL